MGFITFVGKLFLISSIVFQAFLLYHDKKEGDLFNKNLNGAIAHCHCLAPYKQHLLQHLRLVVAGLLASSALILLFRWWSVKLPALLGLLALFWVEHHAVLEKACKLTVSLSILDNVALWHSLGVIGAVIYLLGAECGSCKKQKVVAAAENKAPESSPENSKAPQNNQPSRKSKRA